MEFVYSNDTIDSHDMFKFLGLTGQLLQVCAPFIIFKEVAKKARELKIIATDEDIQQFANTFRRIHGLSTADKAKELFCKVGLTIEDFQVFCEMAVLVDLLKTDLATEAKVQQYYLNHRLEFDSARISIIIVEDDNFANEIITQITECEGDFHTLARDHSLDEDTRYAGGFLGMVTRDELPSGIADRVFNASSNDVLGPFEREDLFWIVLVEEVKKASLDHNIKQAVKERIFNEWTFQFLKGGITICP